jgi:hypothetical protein
MIFKYLGVFILRRLWDETSFFETKKSGLKPLPKQCFKNKLQTYKFHTFLPKNQSDTFVLVTSP